MIISKKYNKAPTKYITPAASYPLFSNCFIKLKNRKPLISNKGNPYSNATALFPKVFFKKVIIEANSDEEKEISLSIIEDASYEYAYKFYQYHLSDKESEILIKNDKNKALIKSSKKGIYHIICEFSRKKNFIITRYKRFIIIVK